MIGHFIVHIIDPVPVIMVASKAIRLFIATTTIVTTNTLDSLMDVLLPLSIEDVMLLVNPLTVPMPQHLEPLTLVPVAFQDIPTFSIGTQMSNIETTFVATYYSWT